MRCTQPVPSRQGEHCPQDSWAKKRTADASASTMDVVSSITITPPDPAMVPASAASLVKVFEDPLTACQGASLVTTDVWTSMGFEAENEARKRAFKDWMVTTGMMDRAEPDALFMHCLPAHRGEEVEAAVIDGPKSVVWDEAENRLHVQKALMEYLLCGRY